MKNYPTDPELQAIEKRVAALSRRATIDPVHKAHLRDELLRRHQELTVGTTQRATRRPSFRLTGLKRLTLVAPPALAALVAGFLLLFSLQPFGRSTARPAEAARLELARARVVATVTGVRMTLQQTHGGRIVSANCHVPAAYGRFYIRGNTTYMYAGHVWYMLALRGQNVYLYHDGWSLIAHSGVNQACSYSRMFAFAQIPLGRALRGASIVPGISIQGHPSDVIRYAATGTAGLQTFMTSWVDRNTGLLLRTSRALRQKGVVIENESATYTYSYRTGA